MAYARTFFFFFRFLGIFFWIFLRIFLWSLPWEPKFQNSTPPSNHFEYFQTYPEFLTGPNKVRFWMFEIFEFPSFNEFFNFINVPYGKTKNFNLQNEWPWSERVEFGPGGHQYSVFSTHFWPLNAQGRSGVIQCISDFGIRLVVERKWVKLEPRMWVFSVYRVFWQLSAYVHSGVIGWFFDLRQPGISKPPGFRAKFTKTWGSGGVDGVGSSCIQNAFDI